MAPVNTRVVRRSNALQDWAYGWRFRYREVMDFGSGLRGRQRRSGWEAAWPLTGRAPCPPSRYVLDRVLPDPARDRRRSSCGGASS